jgi:hypothetical protein
MFIEDSTLLRRVAARAMRIADPWWVMVRRAMRDVGVIDDFDECVHVYGRDGREGLYQHVAAKLKMPGKDVDEESMFRWWRRLTTEAANEKETQHWCEALPYYSVVNKVGKGCIAAMAKDGYNGSELFHGLRYSYARHVLRHNSLAFLTSGCLFCGSDDPSSDTPEHWFFECPLSLMSPDQARRLRAHQLEFAKVLVPADDMVAEEDVVTDEGRCRITCRMSSSAWRPDESRLADPLRRLRAVVSAVARAHKVRVALAPKPEPMFRKASRDQKRKWAWRALLARTVAELDALRRDTGGASLKMIESWILELGVDDSLLVPSLATRRRYMVKMEAFAQEAAAGADAWFDQSSGQIGERVAEIRRLWPDLFVYHYPELAHYACRPRMLHASIGKRIEQAEQRRGMLGARRQQSLADARLRVQHMHINPEQPPRNPHSRGLQDRSCYIFEPG